MTPTDALIEKNLREQQSADNPLQHEVDRRAALIEKMARAIAARAAWGTDPKAYDRLDSSIKKVLRDYARAAYSAEHEEDGK